MLELLDSSSRLLATLEFEVGKDIVENKDLPSKKLIPMKQKDKSTVNPRIRLTLRRDAACADEEGLLTDVKENASVETTLMLQDKLAQMKSVEKLEEGTKAGKPSKPSKPLSELDIL